MFNQVRRSLRTIAAGTAPIRRKVAGTAFGLGLVALAAGTYALERPRVTSLAAPSHVAAGGPPDELSEHERELARALGRRVAALAERLARSAG